MVTIVVLQTSTCAHAVQQRLVLSTALHLTGKVVAGLDGSIHSRDDVARLTAALTRASLPMHYRVTLDSERVAQ